VTAHISTNEDLEMHEQREAYDIPAGVSVYEIRGALFFGAAYKFKESFYRHNVKPLVFIVRMRQVPVIDATGVQTILKVAKSLRAQHTEMLVCELSREASGEKLYELLESKIGAEHIFTTFTGALEEARVIVTQHKSFSRQPGDDPRISRV
jgi:SulP family sulfate permease